MVCCILASPSVYAEDQKELKDSSSTVYYVAYDENGGILQYRNSGTPYLKDGGICSFTSYMCEYKKVIYTSNYTDCTYTSLNPDILELKQRQDKNNGNVVTAELLPKKTGTARIRIDVPEQEDDEYRYRPCTLYCDITFIKSERDRVKFCKRVTENGATKEIPGTRNLRNGNVDSSSFSLTMDEENPAIYLSGIQAEYSSSDENVLEIDSRTGEITLKGTGEVLINANVPEDSEYNAAVYYCRLTVTRKPGIDMNTYFGNVTCRFSEGEYQMVTAPIPGQTLSYASSDPETADVDSSGRVTFRKPGQVCIEVTSSGDSRYDSGPYRTYLTIQDTSLDAAGTAQSSGRAASVSTASKVSAAAAIKLSKPKLKCSKKKRANKLSWSKVNKAGGYQLYIKYPGKKKYQKALTKKATVKSVTHRGLKRGRYYYYKLRAYVKIGGRTYYGPFSKAVKVKVR